MLDLLQKNKHLIKFSLGGNRLSICCLNRVKKILDRNLKEKEDKEPNKLQLQLFKMKHDQQKNQQVKDYIDYQKQEIIKKMAEKEEIQGNLSRLKGQQEQIRANLWKQIEDKNSQIIKKDSNFNTKKSDLLQQKQRLLEELNAKKNELDKNQKEENDLQLELDMITGNEKEITDKYTQILNELEEKLQDQKNKKEFIEKQMQQLREDHSMYQSVEKEKGFNIVSEENKQMIQKKATIKLGKQSTILSNTPMSGTLKQNPKKNEPNQVSESNFANKEIKRSEQKKATKKSKVKETKKNNKK